MLVSQSAGADALIFAIRRYLPLPLEEHEMSRGMPSMVALLGLLAVAGYQNREKIGEMLGAAKQPAGDAPGQQDRQGTQGGVLGNLGGLLGGASAGGILSGGLRDVIDRFTQSGQGEAADSWVKTGPNQPIRRDQLEQAIGPEVLSTLEERTGLSRDELLSRLTRELPAAVDKFTPDGRLPTEAEAARWL
jgi:uncharacterized protein YidB (DUF937 family)